MSDEVVVITPELAPGTGGLADYTLRLLENWPHPADIKILVSPGNSIDPAACPYRTAILASDPSAILAQLPAIGGRVLIQYSAYGFDHFGYPRDFIWTLIDWKKKSGGRLVVMFHEIWTFWPVTNKNFFIQLLHRRAIKRLLQSADEVFTSTSSQGEHLRALSPRTPVHVLPVGSNIRRNENAKAARIPRCAVLFGLQRARTRTLKRMQNDLNSLSDEGVITKIITVGGGDAPNCDAEERGLLAGFKLKQAFEQRGLLPEGEVSELLLTASIGIFAQNELSLGKSGTFMAYAAHELNVLADFADVTKSEPVCWLVSPRELLAQISPVELKTRAQRLLAWQQKNSSWKSIAKRFTEALASGAENS